MTRPEALKWIANVFEEPAEKISPDTPRSAIPAWDSLGVLNLMAAFDQEFGIILSDGEIQSMQAANDILEILRKNGKLTE